MNISRTSKIQLLLIFAVVFGSFQALTVDPGTAHAQYCSPSSQYCQYSADSGAYDQNCNCPDLSPPYDPPPYVPPPYVPPDPPPVSQYYQNGCPAYLSCATPGADCNTNDYSQCNGSCNLSDDGWGTFLYCGAVSVYSCTSGANSCGQTNSGTSYYANGYQCTASPPANPGYLGAQCSASSACGTNYGTYNCSAQCSVGAPAVPGNYGSACTSAPNSCGQTQANGTWQCNGSCSSTPPSNSTCVINQPPNAPTIQGVYQSNNSTYYGASAPSNNGYGYTYYTTNSVDPEGDQIRSIMYVYDTQTSQYLTLGQVTNWYASGQWGGITSQLVSKPAGTYLIGAYTEDVNGNWSPFSGWTTITLVDPVPPTVTNATINAANVMADGSTTYVITTTGSDAAGAADLAQQLALINYQGSNQGSYRGYVLWAANSSLGWSAPTAAGIACSGGGIGQKYGDLSNNNAYGAPYMNLISCATSASGNTRNTMWTVSFNSSFTSPTSNNSVSGYVWSIGGSLGSGWLPFGTFGLTPPLPNCNGSLISSPTTINLGSSATLTWSCSSATSCQFPDDGVTRGASGSRSVSPSTTSSYQLLCTGPAGTANSNIAAITVLTPSATITANPVLVSTGATTDITWTSANVTSCTETGPGLSAATKNAHQVTTINGQSIYTIVCHSSSSPDVTSSVTVNVNGSINQF